jgi:DNA-binding SARP family transcriptional activator
MQPAMHSNVHLREAGTPKIRIFTFGTLHVIRDGVAVTEGDWHTRQARQLLKILLTERPRPVSTDLLIELLWPNSTPNAAATTLRSAINALRNVLEPDRPNRAPSRYIVTQAPGYAFHLAVNIWLDVEDFEHKLNLAHVSADPAVRLALIESAIDLYKDDYLISDPYADWLQNERERLRERFFNALLQAADLYAEGGHYADAITACRRLLARDEVRENAYQSLMRYQAESGDSAGALLTYERCRTILLDELGADPSPLTQMLHQQILNGEIKPRPVIVSATLSSVVSPVVAPVSASASASAAALGALGMGLAAPAGGLPGEGASNIPPLPPRALLPVLDANVARVLVGRESELAHMRSRLQEVVAGQGALLILSGEAGVGKTRLAYHLLQLAAEQEATVISTSCQILEKDLPFAPLADILGRYLYGLPDAVVHSLPPASMAQLTQIVPSLHDRLHTGNLWIVDATVAADENRQRLIDSIVTIVATLANQRPLALFLDDLQWADPDTLAILNRLVQRLPNLRLFLLLAYRGEELAENEALGAFLHGLARTHPQSHTSVPRLSQEEVTEFVTQLVGEESQRTAELGAFLYLTTQGNALFVTEALRDLEERLLAADGRERSLTQLLADESNSFRRTLTLRRNPHLQEIVMERVNRLPQDARTILSLSAVIGRDFSLDLLETAAAHDPLAPLEMLLARRFLLERPDDHLDFTHQVVRQTVYDSLNILQRRRLHLAVAEALIKLGQGAANPGEIAFHYGQAGSSHRLDVAHYSVLAGEKLLHAYGFRQAVDTFQRALALLEAQADSPPDLVRRALQGLGLAYENLFDAEGVATTYRRLQGWARRYGDRQLLLATYSRLTTILVLLGEQSESNEQLHELLAALVSEDGGVPSLVLLDLLERRRLIYGTDEHETNGVLEAEWPLYLPPPPPVADPVADILQVLEPVHAVPPLFDYGWTLLVQGQLGEAMRVLEAVVDLAQETSQPSIASAAYHQLAVTARILGDMEHSQALNDESIAINRAVSGTAAELNSMWPRISSGFLSLHAGRLDEAERRLRRVLDFLEARPSFHRYRNSANIGLGLVKLAHGETAAARTLLEPAVADTANLYPHTHVHALLGLARLADLTGERIQRDRLLRRALRFAGRRSLLEEYLAVVVEIARLRPPTAPLTALAHSMLAYTRAIGLFSAVHTLELLAAEK